MANFSVNVPSEVEEEFRKAAMQKFGMKQGYLTQGLVEAMEDFAAKVKKKRKRNNAIRAR